MQLQIDTTNAASGTGLNLEWPSLILGVWFALMLPRAPQGVAYCGQPRSVGNFGKVRLA
jgi:hypothetical protein